MSGVLPASDLCSYKISQCVFNNPFNTELRGTKYYLNANLTHYIYAKNDYILLWYISYIPQLESWMSPTQSNILAINITAKDVLHAVHYKQDKVH